MARPNPTTDLEAAARQAESGLRVLVQRGSKRVAVMPEADLQRLEDLEDAAEARAAMATSEADGEVHIPMAEVRRRLGHSA